MWKTPRLTYLEPWKQRMISNGFRCLLYTWYELINQQNLNIHNNFLNKTHLDVKVSIVWPWVLECHATWIMAPWKVAHPEVQHICLSTSNLPKKYGYQKNTRTKNRLWSGTRRAIDSISPMPLKIRLILHYGDWNPNLFCPLREFFKNMVSWTWLYLHLGA